MLPFNLGLVRRAVREMLPTTLLCALALATISGLLAYALPQFQARFIARGFIPPQVQQLRSVMLGVDATGNGVADVAFSIAWSHPIVLILLFAQAIIVCTRVPAGEVERGTIDVLLGLPVSRTQLFISETIGWIITAFITLGAVYLGSYVGAQFIKPEYRPNWDKLAMVLVNMGAVYAAIGAIALAAGSTADRRGRAIIFVLLVAVGSLLLNFLPLVWEPSKKFQFLSVLHYYRPIGMLSSGEWPIKNLAVLAGITLTCWSAAWIVLSRRPLTTL